MKKIAIACAAAIIASTAAPALANADRMTDNRLKQWDTDGDGVVTYAEFEAFRIAWVAENNKPANWAKPPAIKRTFAKMDTDGDGNVTRDELLAHTKSQLGS